MRDDVLKVLNEPELLESLYRSNKTAFKEAIEELYLETPNHLMLKTWHIRLKTELDPVRWGSKVDWLLIGIMILISGTLTKLPNWFQLDPNDFFPRYISFLYVPLLYTYFAWKKQIPLRRNLPVYVVWVLGWVYMTLLPGDPESDTYFLASVHFLLFMWTILGYAFVNGELKKTTPYSRFLFFNGEFLILSVILGLSGVLFLVITTGLFSAIGIPTEPYINRFGVYGLSAIPFISTHLLHINPTLLNKISPIVARLFSPAALTMFIVYLVASLIKSANPYADREYLVILNGLLVAVMALILFSVSDAQPHSTTKFQQWMLILLAIASLIIDVITLSAILYRITEWGITPNRFAVLGSNLLIFIHLSIVLMNMIGALQKEKDKQGISNSIGSFLPVYSAWFLGVAILFPILFSFK